MRGQSTLTDCVLRGGSGRSDSNSTKWTIGGFTYQIFGLLKAKVYFNKLGAYNNMRSNLKGVLTKRFFFLFSQIFQSLTHPPPHMGWSSWPSPAVP